MAETGEIVAGASGLGAFLGALFGALKLFGHRRDLEPDHNSEKTEMAVLLTRMSDMERRQTETDARIDDVFHLLEKTSDALAGCRVNIATALAKLDERRTQ